MSAAFDVIIAGAGSVGLPAAFFLAEAGVKVAVFDPEASPGRGQNRAAIGGIRATHSDRAKIALCRESIDFFASFKERTGDDIGWRRGGYTFVAYSEPIETMLRTLVEKQKTFGLVIDWVGPEKIVELVPGVATAGLLGGTFSPEDGSASPLLCATAFKRRAEEKGARFFFREPVTRIRVEGGKVRGVDTPKAHYEAPVFVNAAGAAAREIGALAGLTVPVEPDCHEAGITEPVARFMEPMVVDIRPAPGSKNFYFYQNAEGQVVFCITPDPPILGTDNRSTSVFLPMVAKRMVALLPRLANLKIRRVWRGLYPMTPDGSPLLGRAAGIEGYYLAAGMCGQGYMLGPGVGALLSRLLTGRETPADRDAIADLRPDREFRGMEALK
ncbi:MAG: FAD-binding oxidoreductase [Planctomycetes bacterium]|jgi:sarcosine oxidase subunit beta|nr:FAD-binding oxidoreductase [Planctomycetota bacterium]